MRISILLLGFKWLTRPQGLFIKTKAIPKDNILAGKKLYPISKHLRAIFWENRESQDTRQKIEFFFIFPKHPF